MNVLAIRFGCVLSACYTRMNEPPYSGSALRAGQHLRLTLNGFVEFMTRPSRIHILPTLLVNKIAAGEVIERPASVVKELVENALDAGATRISVTIEDGGKQLIRVTDDGHGLTAEELRLAVTPHATSKLVTEEDLYNISTMGFRGEALASISAVSRLRIASRPRGDIEGHEIRVAAEEIESSRTAGCPEGTTVEVRDLFFNVPARRKFLRSPSAESGHINEQVTRAALARPDVAFEVSNHKRVTHSFPVAADRRERVARVYGPELAEALLPIGREERGLRIEAYVAPPAQSRATAQWQYTFVNGRYVRDRFLQHAIKEAYRGLMEPYRHGVVFLFLTLDPRDIDVNVHPTKLEIRWADSGLIHSQVLSALRETFQRADLTPAFRNRPEREPVSEQEQERIRAELAAMFKNATPIQPGQPARYSQSGGVGGGSSTGSRELAGRDSGAIDPRSVDPGQLWRALYGPPPAEKTADFSEGLQHRDMRADSQVGGLQRGNAPLPEPGAHATDFPDRTVSGWPLGSDLDRTRRRAVQMHNLYLVAETEDGIVIVDQHALHERVMYEHLRRRIASGSLEAQRLLLPETLNVASDQVELLETNESLLKRLGIEVTPFGTGSIAVHAVPSILKDTQVVPFVRDLLDKLAQQAGEISSDAVINDILAMMACKAAVKAGDPLSAEEIESLMAQRHLLDQPSACPHGRPTSLRLTKNDLNRQFHRT
jgi:DNA mismatch repair protein MutL